MASVKLLVGPFSERPSSVNSGPTVEETAHFHHRSEMLMNEQIETVRRAQDDLKQALLDLDSVKDEREIKVYAKRVEDLEYQAQQMVILLQICSKVNIELAYARQALRNALRTRSDSTGPRQRVIWLEDRMEKLLGTSIETNASPRRHVKTPRKYTIPLRRKQDSKLKKNNNDTFDGSEEKPRTPADIKRKSVASFSTVSAPPDYSVLDSLRQARLNLLVRSSPVLAEEDTSLTDELLKDLRSNQKLVEDEYVKCEENDDQISRKGFDETDQATRSLCDGEGVQVEMDQDSEHRMISSIVVTGDDEDDDLAKSNHHSMADLSDHMTHSSPEAEPDEDQPKETHAGIDENTKQTFLTEGSFVSIGSQISKTSRVTIKTPSEEDLEEVRPSSVSMLTREDFFTEHSQYFFNKYMVELDPASYHQMGIALPATFVKSMDESEEETALPWRPKKKKVPTATLC